MIRSCAVEGWRQHSKVGPNYSNRRIPPQRKTYTEVDGLLIRLDMKQKKITQGGLQTEKAGSKWFNPTQGVTERWDKMMIKMGKFAVWNEIYGFIERD